MSDPKNSGKKKSEGRIGPGVEADKGGNKSTGRGRASPPNRPAPPKPEYNPNK